MRDQPPDATLDVVILGAGFGGLAAAIELQEQQLHNFVILERAAQIGGTWRDNTYPGCACDIPSHLYSLSRVPKLDWSRRYPQQAEILGYMHEVLERRRLGPHLRLNCTVSQARWDADASVWLVDFVQNGVAGELRAKHLVAAPGPLNKPAIPVIEGIESFPGVRFHTMDWKRGVDLRGKRVAVVGSGASAVQVIPEIAKLAAALGVFQRTPAWVIPRLDAPYGAMRRWLHRSVPGLQRLNRWRIYWRNELFALNYLGFAPAQKLLLWATGKYLAHQIKDPTLRAKLTPSYLPGCKRMLVSDEYLPALASTRTQVIASAVARCEGSTLIGANGEQFEADVLVYATGFRLTEFVKPLRVIGTQAELGDLWSREPAVTWRGLMSPHFPNLYFMLGPNTGLGSNSVVFMIESQAQAMARIVAQALADRTSVAPTQAAARAWYTDVQARMQKTVWASGCASYYQSAGGRIDSLWPGFTWSYWMQMRAARARELDAGRN